MRLFYSGAGKIGYPQLEASKSLGGFPSSTPLVNNGLNNVFPPITKDVVRNLYQDCRLIVLKNTTGVAVSNISIYTVRGVYDTLEIAAVAPAIDTCGDAIFEKIDDGHSIPFQATLAVQLIGNPITVSALADQAYIGIWIQRTLDQSQFTYIDGLPTAPDPDCPTLASLLNAQSPATYDQSQLVISWT